MSLTYLQLFETTSIHKKSGLVVGFCHSPLSHDAAQERLAELFSEQKPLIKTNSSEVLECWIGQRVRLTRSHAERLSHKSNNLGLTSVVMA